MVLLGLIMPCLKTKIKTTTTSVKMTVITRTMRLTRQLTIMDLKIMSLSRHLEADPKGLLRIVGVSSSNQQIRSKKFSSSTILTSSSSNSKNKRLSYKRPHSKRITSSSVWQLMKWSDSNRVELAIKNPLIRLQVKTTILKCFSSKIASRMTMKRDSFFQIRSHRHPIERLLNLYF